MFLTSCCFSDKKSGTYVKIVYPGGRIELYDRPILASEIMSQNPRSCVTLPDVFQQPWAAVVPPNAERQPLGGKFYVVPMRTLRKLRRNLLMYSGSPHREDSHSHNPFSNLNTLKREEKRSDLATDEKEMPCSLRRQSRQQPRESSPGTPSYHWQPSLTSIVEE